MPERFAARLKTPPNSRWFDPALVVVVAAEPALAFAVTGQTLRPAAIAVIAALCLAVIVRRRHAVSAALSLCPLILAFGLIDDFPRENVILFTGLAVLCYTLGTREDRAASLGAAACLFLTCQALKIEVGDPMSPPFLFLTAGPWIFGMITESRRALVSELAERAEEVRAEVETYRDLVVRRERARIARELHDIVAHCVAVMVIQAGAGRLASDGSREQAALAFSRIREAGTEACLEMEKLVSLLSQDDPASGPSGRLGALVGQVRAAGLDVELIASPDAEADDTAFRIVQEGLTNALKHAPGASVKVALVDDGEGVTVDVTNAAAGPAGPAVGFESSRRGLVGIRERVGALDGQMESGALPDGGWRLHVHLPRARAAKAGGPGSVGE
ncbi:MAG: hypothetical protein NVS2B6_04990 [Thermoleophilaceae bacterium]